MARGRTASKRGTGAVPESLAERIVRLAPTLTAAERRVAEVMLAADRVVAFGTVAAVAEAAGAGAATVVRTAAKLGFEGFTELQAEVRQHFVGELEPAVERIRRAGETGEDVVATTLEVEMANLRRTFAAVDTAAVDALADDLADLRHGVMVMGGEAATAIAAHWAHDLGALRPGVAHLVGNPVAVASALAQGEPGDLLIVIDLRRYDRWLVEATALARAQGRRCAVVSDSALSPLAGGAHHHFVVGAAARGPFDSYVGVVALGNLVVAAAAERLRRVATDRLERAEAAWQRANALLDS